MLVYGEKYKWIYDFNFRTVMCIPAMMNHIFIFFSAVQIFGLSYIHLYLHHVRVYYEFTMWPAPSWLDSSVGRALHRYCRVISQSECLIWRLSLATTTLLIWDKRAVLTKEFQDKVFNVSEFLQEIERTVPRKELVILLLWICSAQFPLITASFLCTSCYGHYGKLHALLLGGE